MGPNPLIGVVLIGHGKDYCVPKFIEMAATVYKGYDVVFAVDEIRYDLDGHRQISVSVPDLGVYSNWAGVACDYGKEMLRQHALYYLRYDALMWQGVDCFYDSREDFESFLKLAYLPNIRAISALTAGRGKPDYPVCREFVEQDGKLSTKQVEFDRSKLNGLVVECKGYPSSDATLLKRDILGVGWTHGYEPWYERKDWDEDALDVDEFRFWRMCQAGITPMLASGVRTWHCHDVDLLCSRYPGEQRPLSEMKWT